MNRPVFYNVPSKKDDGIKGAVRYRFHMEGMLAHATQILEQALGYSSSANAALGSSISPAVLERAQGLVFLSTLKAGFIFGGEAGSGVAVSKLADGTWSPPAAVQVGKGSCGFQGGASVTDLLLVFTTVSGLKKLSEGHLSFGADVQLAVGPVGRDAKLGAVVGESNLAACYAYSYSKGLFGGVSLEGGGMWPHPTENARFYGGRVHVADVFLGCVAVPVNCPELERFRQTLALLGVRNIPIMPTHPTQA